PVDFVVPHPLVDAWQSILAKGVAFRECRELLMPSGKELTDAEIAEESRLSEHWSSIGLAYFHHAGQPLQKRSSIAVTISSPWIFQGWPDLECGAATDPWQSTMSGKAYRVKSWFEVQYSVHFGYGRGGA
ncbi:hypothetical protein CPC16_011861, partial [Podila verticillata]